VEAALEGRRLAEAEERWRSTIDNAPIGIALVDLDGRWLRVNRTLCQIVGFTEAELLARSFQDITHPSDLDIDLEQVGRVMRGELDHYTLEKRYIHADGHHVWVRLAVSLALDATGAPLHFIAHVEDVTEQRRTSQRLERIIASARDAFVSIDVAGRITEWNRAAEEMFGWTRAEALGLPSERLIVPEHRNTVMDGLRRVAENGETALLDDNVEISAVRRDGTEFPVELSVWRIEDGAGEFHSFVRDISERVAARLRARREAERQAALIAVQLDLAQVELSPTKVMNRICEKAQELTGSDHATIEIHEGDDMVYRAATPGFRQHVGLHLPFDTTISGLCVRSGRMMECVDAFEDPRVDNEGCRKVGVRSMLLAPLRNDQRVVGVLKVLSSNRDFFTAEDREILDVLAVPFGSTISNAWTLESTTRRSAHDPLTGLANRGRSLAVLKRTVEEGDATSAVLFIDLDGFKKVNDRHGHATGDELLGIVAQRIKGAVRPVDTAGRVGGDEFLVISTGATTRARAEALAERLVAAIIVPYRLPTGLDVELGASIGIALVHAPASAPEVLAAADKAMYAAKRAGGNRWRLREH
jgi:diguanylate cyclase (GGDEF)-like protein/PAS domain S-box-containing protein